MTRPKDEELTLLKQKSIELKKKIRELRSENSNLKAELTDLTDSHRMLAHDLKTPLTGMKLTVETLIETIDEQPTERVTTQLGKVVTLVDKMGKLIREIIEQDRRREAGLDHELRPISVKSILTGCINQLEATAQKKRINLVFIEDQTTDPIVLGDESLLDAVICNILSNGIKYSPAGTEVTLWSERSGNNLQIKIRDQGQGLSPFEIEKLFNSYETMSTKPTNNESQTGLGLYVSQKMMSKMGGFITAYSQGKDMGSTFQIDIPLAPESIVSRIG